MSKLKIVDGRLLVLATLRRKLAAIGYSVSKSHLSKVFLGERNPSIHLLEALAKATNLTLDEMWKLINKVRDKQYWHPTG